ncbi:NADH-quinone oxidoreductase subunit NuoF [Photobacterium alginatilyticum]|uniref:NADH-quinone oxidoreductase subunit NuoF n=1 Tax=Photobacterium alginatilyticum TaxID=1775171 RepID=UPI004068C052
MFEPVLLKNAARDNAWQLAVYQANGGYEAWRKVLSSYKPTDVIGQVKASNLRGRGGAGFPTGLKWSFIPADSPSQRYLCCNADEGEPGTFKDKFLMEQDPHQLLEGMAIAAYAIGAHRAYIYLRYEFRLALERLQQAIDSAREQGLLGTNIFGSGFDLEVYIHRNAGAYICGEETALLQSLEGYRGEPRLKPPFPAIKGYCASPTVVNNVETLACIPSIFTNGAEWFAAIGPEKSPGPKLYCLSGQVNKPGLYELPMGVSLRELIEVHGRGCRDGYQLKAVIPGGVSAPMLPADQVDIAMDFNTLAAAGSMLGSAGVIVMDNSASIVEVTKRTMEFFSHESCGKCSPCREGTLWAVKILRRFADGTATQYDLSQLHSLCNNIAGNSFCALADGAIMALRAALKHFEPEFTERINSSATLKSEGGIDHD